MTQVFLNNSAMISPICSVINTHIWQKLSSFDG
jgi:hypothetical protein